MPEALSPQEIADNFAEQLFTVTKRKLGLRKLYPGCCVNYRRAARTGDNQDVAAVVVLKPGERYPIALAISFDAIDRAADSISDAEVMAELFRCNSTDS